MALASSIVGNSLAVKLKFLIQGFAGFVPLQVHWRHSVCHFRLESQQGTRALFNATAAGVPSF